MGGQSYVTHRPTWESNCTFRMLWPILVKFGLVNIRTFCCAATSFVELKAALCRSQWPRGLRRSSAAARQLRVWVRIPPGAWMSVCCKLRAFSARGLFDELLTRPEESYRLWCVVMCDIEMSWMRRPWPTGGWGLLHQRQNKTKPCFYCGHKWNLPLFSACSSGLDKISYGRYPPQFIDVSVVVIGALTAIQERKRISTPTVHI